MNKLKSSKRGFTLIELLVTIGILAIMLVVGVPSFSNLIETNKLKTTRDLLITSIHSAQQQASSKTVPVYLCPSSNGTSCDSAWNSGDGWLLYEDLDRDGFDTSEIFLVENHIKVDKITSTNALLE